MRKLLGLLVLISGMAIGQELDTLALDTVPKVPSYFGGVYLNGGSIVAPNPPGINQSNFIGAGMQYNRWSIDFLIVDFYGTIERFIIFPNIFELKYRYGGLSLSYEKIQSRWVNAAIQTSFSKGDMVWREVRSTDDFLRSKFNMWTVGAKVEMVKLRFIRPYLNAGYQRMAELNLTGVEDEEFSGFFFGVGLRLGLFNQ